MKIPVKVYEELNREAWDLSVDMDRAFEGSFDDGTRFYLVSVV